MVSACAREGSSLIRSQPGLEHTEQRAVLARQHGARVEHDLVRVDPGGDRRIGQAQRALVGAGDARRARSGPAPSRSARTCSSAMVPTILARVTAST
jgi:hypothetical protein